MAEAEPVAGPQGAREHPDVDDLLAAGAALDLKDLAGDRPSGVTCRGRQQLGERGHQGRYPGSGDRGAEEDRMHQCAPGLRGELAAQPRVGNAGVVLDVAGQDVLVMLGEGLSEPGTERSVGGTPRSKTGAAGTQRAGRAHRDDGRGQPLRDRPQHASGVGTGPVDLVHEEQHRQLQPLQRAHQHAGLRLHALDGGDDQDHAVQDAQHPLHLGDEVGVAGSVEQVDGDVADGERRDRGPDRDAALPLGERGLPGVYMRQDAKVEQSGTQASYPPRSSSPAMDMNARRIFAP